MAGTTCDACGRAISVAGGLENVWTMEGKEGTGIRLEFDDGRDVLLCFPCVESLPEEPTPADVDDLMAGTDAEE